MAEMGLTLFFLVSALLLQLSTQNLSPVQPQEEDAVTSTSLASDMTSRILEANQGINHTLLEGDVALPRQRNAMRCWTQSCRWPKSSNGLVEVPYTLSNDFYHSEKAAIRRAMRTFHLRTCVRFVPRRAQRDFLSIQSEMGCWSTLGRSGGEQVLSLSAFGCLENGIVQHELLHALGFHHEHTRSDRDRYVSIHWENVPTTSVVNFNKANTNNLNTPYDYSSVMHYGRSAFSDTYGVDTITPVPDSSVSIGQRQHMSDLDVLRVNRLYQCNV